MINLFIPIRQLPLYQHLKAIFFTILGNLTDNRIGKQKTIFLTDSDRPTFFGYHDKTPFSADNLKVLAMSVNADDTKPENECTPMKLGYFVKSELSGTFENQFHTFAETRTWCWQQGCMLQWHPLYPDNMVVYNTLVDGTYGSAVFDLKENAVNQEYSHPVYSIDPKGRVAATLNFSRLGRLRPGYGYSLLPDKTEGKLAPENDGLFVFDLATGKETLLFSLAELSEEISLSECEHYINHVTFSPDGQKIAFFHLWVDSDLNRRMRFQIYDFETEKRLIIEDENKVSHYCWISINEVLATVKGQNTKNWTYRIYDTGNLKKKNSNLTLKTDGHPMRSPVNKKIFVTDFRPNRFRKDSIIIFNIENCKRHQIGRFFMPIAYSGQVRCDLHPRWDRHGSYISVDTIKKRSHRAMAIIEVQDIVENISKNS